MAPYTHAHIKGVKRRKDEKVNGGSGGGGGEDEREEWMRPGVEGEAEGNGERKARVEDDRAPKYTEMSSL
ncbi:hypothetical protein GW17_00027006 [Ensete ventricosum]|nr:hypothetical protein GW17_00027006 [Ensete ventricosum]RZR81203.1 hypothetical protein BHM03_00007391 [Ensete ventricosum]